MDLCFTEFLKNPKNLKKIHNFQVILDTKIIHNVGGDRVLILNIATYHQMSLVINGQPHDIQFLFIVSPTFVFGIDIT